MIDNDKIVIPEALAPYTKFDKPGWPSYVLPDPYNQEVVIRAEHPGVGTYSVKLRQQSTGYEGLLREALAFKARVVVAGVLDFGWPRDGLEKEDIMTVEHFATGEDLGRFRFLMHEALICQRRVEKSAAPLETE